MLALTPNFDNQNFLSFSFVLVWGTKSLHAKWGLIVEPNISCDFAGVLKNHVRKEKAGFEGLR